MSSCFINVPVGGLEQSVVCPSVDMHSIAKTIRNQSKISSDDPPSVYNYIRLV